MKRLRADFCAPSFEERCSPGTGGQEGANGRRGCARTFARPPLRSAVPPGLAARKGQWKEEGPMERRGCARTFARPSLRSGGLRGLVTRKGQRKEEAARGLLRALL